MARDPGAGAGAGPRTERDRQRAHTETRLYEAALEVFRRDGVAESRIDDIAQLAGVSRGTFYFHFPSKDDVLARVMRESQLVVVAEIEALDPSAPLVEVLATVAAAIARTWEHDAVMLAEIGMVALRQTALDLTDTGRAHPLQRALTPRFARATDRAEIGALIPPDLLSQFFLVNLFGAALAWTGQPVVPLDALLRNVVTFFLRAARA